MSNVLVTGASGFLGRNLVVSLERLVGGPQVRSCPHTVSDGQLSDLVGSCDLIFHLAGVNRPSDSNDFQRGNVDFTARLVAAAATKKDPPTIIFASSTQAGLANLYGESKKAAEDELLGYARRCGAKVAILRFSNIFGKWSRPNYNTVVATFCHNLITGQDLNIRDPDHKVSFIYVADAVASLQAFLDPSALSTSESFYKSGPNYEITLGQLAGLLQQFHAERHGHALPALDNPFVKFLYATYTSFHSPTSVRYSLEQRVDPRGSLVEFVKSPSFGQILVSTSKPGVVRGHHYHDTKVEKFLVVKGSAKITIRDLSQVEPWVIEVSGDKPEVVAMPPGCTHAIENTGHDEMILVVWANEVFDPASPDTFPMPV